MTARRTTAKILFLLTSLLIFNACVSVKYQEDIFDYQDEIEKLQFRIRGNGSDAEAMRDLGAIYFQVRDYRQAKTWLKRALAADNTDPKTQFYVGLSAEFDNREAEALQIYRLYRQASRLSPYRKLMEGRYHWLRRASARREAREMLKEPVTIQSSKIDQEAIAVFPMIYRGSDDQYLPLGRGLSEMILIDLGKVDGVKLIERIRIQALLDELAFGRSHYVDPATSPRYGQILGAGRMVSGIFNVYDQLDLAVDATSWDLNRTSAPLVSAAEDELENLFLIEKKLVADILLKLGITPSESEKDSLAQIPTSSFPAFLLYSSGLERQDAGDFQQAIKLYQEALKQDPTFALAAQQLERASSLSLIGGTKEKAKRVAKRAGEEADEKAEQIGERLGKVGAGMGASFGGAQDGRRPIDDVVNSGLLDDTLPEPPPPPR